MDKAWINIRLERLFKKLSVLEGTSYTISNNLEFFLNQKNLDDLDTIIYSQESIEGVAEIISDVKIELMELSEQITEEREGNSLPDKI